MPQHNVGAFSSYAVRPNGRYLVLPVISVKGSDIQKHPLTS